MRIVKLIKSANMKKIAIYTVLCASLSLSSCDMFKLDNYEEPQETLRGEVVDVATGERILTDQGSEGIRVRLVEVSYGPNATPNPDINCKSDGTFQNTKLFKGEYNIRVDGPFIPIVREDTRGVPLADESKTVVIDGVQDVRFEVQPFLKVEWASIPVAANGKISVKVKVSRGVDNAIFREKIEPTCGDGDDAYTNDFLNVTDVQLFVSYSSSVGYRARDERWSGKNEYAGSAFNTLLGTDVPISSIGNIPSGRKVYIRAAARINYATASIYRFNYSEPLEVYIP